MDFLSMLGQAALQGNFNMPMQGVPVAPAPEPVDPGSQDQQTIVVNAEQDPIELQREVLLTRLGAPPVQKMVNGVLREDPRTYRPGTGGDLPKGRKVLADVLGLLGDSFLVQAGKDKIYEPYKQNQKIAEALEMERATPGSGMRYLERADANVARKIFESNRSAAIDREEIAARQSVADQRRREARLKAFGVIGGYANAIKGEEDYQSMRPILQDYLDENDIEFTLPEKYTPDIMAQLTRAALGPYKEGRLSQQSANTASLVGKRKADIQLGQGRLANEQERTDIARGEAESKDEKRQWEMDNPPASRSAGRSTGSGAPKGPPGSVALGDGRFRLPDGRVVKVKGQ